MLFGRKIQPPSPAPDVGLRPIDAAPSAGLYAMWTPSGPEPTLPGTRTMALLDEAYALFGPVASVACGAVAQEVGWVERAPGIHRVKLPEELITAYVEAADGTRLIVSAEAAKGIRFHFAEGTSAAVREALLERWCAHLRVLHQLYVDGHLQADPAAEESPGEWWAAMKAALTNLPMEGGGPQAVGGIQI